MGRPARVLPAGETLLTGHFQVDASYSTVRTDGSDDWLIIATAAGAGWIGRADLEVTAGHLVAWRPRAAQDYRTAPARAGRRRRAPGWDLWWAHVLPDEAMLDLLDWPEVAPGLLHLRVTDAAVFAAVLADLRQMVHDAAGSARAAQDLARLSLHRALTWAAEVNPARGGTVDPRVRATMDRLLGHVAPPRPGRRGPDLPTLAAAVGLSPSRLGHLFTRQTGLAPLQWLDRMRHRRAAELLRSTDWPVAAVGRAVGFADPFHFSGRFRRAMGASPRAWRQRRR